MATCHECKETLRQGSEAIDQGVNLQDAVCLCGNVWAWEQSAMGRTWSIRRRVNPLQRLLARVLRRTVWA